jgi:hypothetical protein
MTEKIGKNSLNAGMLAPLLLNKLPYSKKAFTRSLKGQNPHTLLIVLEN